VDALYELHRAFEAEQNLPFRTSRAELVHDMAEPETDLATDTRVAVAPDGTFLASARLDVSLRRGPKHRAYLITMARADHGDLELEAIRWAEAEANTRFAAVDDDLPRVIRSFAEANSTDRIDRYQSCGFPVVRHYVDMVRSLAEPFGDPELPDGVELVPWEERWLPSSFEAHAEAFQDHWGSLPPTWEEWQHRASWPGCRPDLSHVAVADGEVVAYCMNGVYPQDWDVIGRKDGWVEVLGTRRAWRKQGLASALLTASFCAFADAGLDAASIGVDAANPTGAFHLYEALGFREEHRAVSMMKEIKASD
jgi:ribosomal protein S18 acetylase RimI-like enzyme